MFNADSGRFKRMLYRRVGNSGLRVSILSLGLAQNFTEAKDYQSCREIVLTAFNNGINYFDLSNSFGFAESHFGKILKDDLLPYRSEIIIGTKCGGKLFDGPCGEGGSRKHIFSSIDNSLRNLGIPYVDILFHQTFDNDINPDETAFALADVVKAGKAIYIGLSDYSSLQLRRIAEIFKRLNVPFIVAQVKYSLLERNNVESEDIVTTQSLYEGGVFAYQPLEQGLLSNKYITETPADSRAKKANITTLSEKDITVDLAGTLTKLNLVAATRGQSIVQLALAWTLRNAGICTATMGISKMNQLGENLGALKRLTFTSDELKKINSATEDLTKKKK